MGAWTSFEESFIHTDDHKVLGYHLKPFSLYHQFILEAVASPVMGGKSKITIFDLEIACRICASDYNTYQKVSKRPNFFQKMIWILRALWYSLPKELKKFDAYFEDYVSLPERYEGKTASKDGKVYSDFPAPLSVAGCLMANGFEAGRRKEIWMTPLGEAHWYCATFLRMEGVDLKLITEHDREFIEGLRKRREDNMKANAAPEVSEEPESEEDGEFGVN